MTVAEIRAELHEPTETFQNFLHEHPELAEDFEAARNAHEEKPVRDAEARYGWATVVQRAAIHRSGAAAKKSRTDRIDTVLTHRVFGLIVFVAVMYGVFQSIYTFAQPLMDWIDADLFGRIKEFASGQLASMPMVQSFVVDGLITGVGSMLVFLPQILILFFFIAVLEGTGYLARAAFLMDRLLGWCGLNGRAFIPLLSSFACAIPGIMAARVMPDPKSRLATILVAPLMSCSARVPVYLLLVSAFIQPVYGRGWAMFAFFAMHLLGLLVAIPIVWFLNRKMIRGTRLPFLLELPPYQWPKPKDVWLTMFFRAKGFVKTAGSIIVVMSVVIWALSSFPKLTPAQEAQIGTKAGAQVEQVIQEEQLRNSALGQFGRAIEPAFLPAGFDWRITTSILSAFPARETVVSSLGIIFSLGGDVDEADKGLQESLKRATWPDGRPLFNPWNAVGLMVFFALCAQCMATLATVRRETNSWRWPWFMFGYMTTLAYVAAVGIYQLGRALGKV
ncbi:MAG: ferrous iron transporter B [Verrucomicrobiaceae bacterium]|nr:MAG: ferrous iron transporter B [Verrucomicrobiaceae bacterium]